jgi:hypothetical protein
MMLFVMVDSGGWGKGQTTKTIKRPIKRQRSVAMLFQTPILIFDIWED